MRPRHQAQADQRPFQTSLRFPTKACKPSLRSSELSARSAIGNRHLQLPALFVAPVAALEADFLGRCQCGRPVDHQLVGDAQRGCQRLPGRQQMVDEAPALEELAACGVGASSAA